MLTIALALLTLANPLDHRAEGPGHPLRDRPGQELTGELARGPLDELLLHLRLSTDTAYPGQQVTLLAEAWVSPDAQLRIRRAPEYHPPSPTGFWTHDLPRSTRSGRSYFNEQPYRVQEFRRAYFPLTPGRYQIPPAKLIYEVRRSFRYATDHQEIATDPIELVVLPLPERGRPSDFAGAVGEFDITALLEPASIPEGEATALTVEVTGRGHIRALPPPRLPQLPGIETHTPTEDAQIDERDGIIRGVKRFTWILVPREPGVILLPPIEYHYFDPELREYRTATSQPLELEVRESEERATTEDPPRRTTLTQEIGSTRRSLQNLPIGGISFIIAPLIALMTIIGTARRRRRRDRDQSTRLPSKPRRRQAELRTIRKRASNPEHDTLRELDQLLRREAAALIGGENLRWSRAQKLASALQEAGLPPPTTSAIRELLNRIEEARYQPEPPDLDTRLELLDEAEHLLRILAHQVP